MSQPLSAAAKRLMGVSRPAPRFRDGGLVRGPGTPTSDSVDAKLSRDEFVLPADTVRAVGIKSLRDLVASTHAPTGSQPRGRRFADGGMVDDEKLKPNVINSPSNTFPGNRLQGDSGFSGASVSPPTSAVPVAAQTPDFTREQLIAQIPKDDGPAVSSGRTVGDSWTDTDLGRNVYNSAMALPGVAAAIPGIVKTGGAISSGINAASRLLNTGSSVIASGAAFPTAAAALSPEKSGAYSAGSGRGRINPTFADPNQPPPTSTIPAPPPAPEPEANKPTTTGNVTREGNSYSGVNVAGDISINGKAPAGSVSSLPSGAAPSGIGSGLSNFSGGGFPASAESSANNLDARSRLESMGRLMASGQIQTPKAGPSFILSGNTGFRRARSILAGELGAQRQFDYAQGNDPASRKRNAELQRTAMREAGDTHRALIGAQHYNDANAIARGELAIKRDAAAFQNRSAQRQEQVQQDLENAKTPEDQRNARQRLLALMGKTDDDHWQGVALQGGMDAQGNKTDSVLAAVNRRTGEMRRLPTQPTQQAAPPDGTKVRGQDGRTYVVKNGQPVPVGG